MLLIKHSFKKMVNSFIFVVFVVVNHMMVCLCYFS